MSKVVAGKSLKKNYTPISNSLIRNSEIDDSTFRLICWMTSHDEGFEINFNNIQIALGYGRDKLRKILKNAEYHNYLVRRKIRTCGGLFDCEYHIFKDCSDAIAFRSCLPAEELTSDFTSPKDSTRGVNAGGGQTGGGETGGGETGGGQTGGGRTRGGESTPLKEKQYKENQIKENQNREQAHSLTLEEDKSEEIFSPNIQPTPTPQVEKLDQPTLDSRVEKPDQPTPTPQVEELDQPPTLTPQLEKLDQPAPDSQLEELDQPTPDSQLEELDQPTPNSQLEKLDQPTPDSQLEKLDQPAPTPQVEELDQPAPNSQLEKPDQPTRDSHSVLSNQRESLQQNSDPGFDSNGAVSFDNIEQMNLPLASTENTTSHCERDMAKIQHYQQLHAQGITLKFSELRDWAKLEIEQYVRTYRKSGFILSGGGTDISREFAIYVSDQNCKKWEQPTTTHGYNLIKKCERDPSSWQNLVDWVEAWQQQRQTNTPVNVAAAVTHQQQLDRIRLAASTKFEL